MLTTRPPRGSQEGDKHSGHCAELSAGRTMSPTPARLLVGQTEFTGWKSSERDQEVLSSLATLQKAPDAAFPLPKRRWRQSSCTRCCVVETLDDGSQRRPLTSL